MQAPLIGIDLIEPERLRRKLGRSPGLANRLFHAGELAYCRAQAVPERHLAARFSAKEAVTKVTWTMNGDMVARVVGAGARMVAAAIA